MSGDVSSTDEKVCRWAPIEEGSPVYQPGCCTEEWQLDDGRDLYPYCHWCGGKIEEVEAEADEPRDPDGECFRGGEAAGAIAEEQSRIQRELK